MRLSAAFSSAIQNAGPQVFVKEGNGSEKSEKSEKGKLKIIYEATHVDCVFNCYLDDAYNVFTILFYTWTIVA